MTRYCVDNNPLTQVAKEFVVSELLFASNSLAFWTTMMPETIFYSWFDKYCIILTYELHTIVDFI